MAQSRERRNQRRRRPTPPPAPRRREDPRRRNLRRVVIAFLVLVGLAGILSLNPPSDGSGAPAGLDRSAAPVG